MSACFCLQGKMLCTTRRELVRESRAGSGGGSEGDADLGADHRTVLDRSNESGAVLIVTSSYS
jgi:hypothetical protein